MIQVVTPDYVIKVGIKDGEVVSQDWSEMIAFDKTIKDTFAINNKLSDIYYQSLKKIGAIDNKAYKKIGE